MKLFIKLILGSIAFSSLFIATNLYPSSAAQKELEAYLKNMPVDKQFSSEGQVFKDLNFNIQKLTAESKFSPTRMPGRAPDWGTDFFEGMSFENISFEDCHFQWLNFAQATFKNVTFKHCNFEGALFDKATLENVKFINCDLRNASFQQANLNHATFDQSLAPFVSFMHAHLQNTLFTDNFLHGSHFFGATTHSVRFEGDAENVLFYDTAAAFGVEQSLTKPVILISWNNKKPALGASKIVKKIQELGGIPFKFNSYDPDIDPIQLKEEVDRIIATEKVPHPDLSIPLPQKFFIFAEQGNYPEIAKIQKKAFEWIHAVSGVLIPGGEDIHPYLYRHEPADETTMTEDLRRDLFEFAVLKEVEKTQKPVLGICRGMQVANIWYGGSLNQHVNGHLFVVQNYHLAKPFQSQSGESVIARIFNKGPFTGYSFHHQTIQEIGKGLTPTAYAADETIKALEKLGGKFEVYVQWHPEFKGDSSTPESAQLEQKLSPGNHEIYQHFIDETRAYHS